MYLKEASTLLVDLSHNMDYGNKNIFMQTLATEGGAKGARASSKCILKIL